MEIRMGEGKIIVQVEPDLESIMPQFFQNQSVMVNSLKKAVSERDFETAERLGHSMKGYGGGYGFDTLSEIGAELETAAVEESPSELTRLIGEVEAYLGRVEVVYLEE